MKLIFMGNMEIFHMVSLCVREWIETYRSRECILERIVSLCVREWIETLHSGGGGEFFEVSLCVREWIETLILVMQYPIFPGLPLREGVD